MVNVLGPEVHQNISTALTTKQKPLIVLPLLKYLGLIVTPAFTKIIKALTHPTILEVPVIKLITNYHNNGKTCLMMYYCFQNSINWRSSP